jgi:AraC-like DNA-binding protein
MENFYKYLPVSKEDQMWGLHVLNAGCNIIGRNASYPSRDHPAHHYFNWNKGRILDEYQVIYITQGTGTFQSASVKESKVTEGSVFVLFPHEWHRFKPDKHSGWNECWVGFKGTIADNLVINQFFNSHDALLDIGMNDEIMSLLLQIIGHAKNERPGYQALISGIVLHLMGHIYSTLKGQNITELNHTELIINKARLILRANIEKIISVESLAEELNVSYSWFRRAFKDYTGIPPNQYHLQLKIEKAKLLLAEPSQSIKEIGLALNFETPSHFSKLFKNKTGLSPEQFRVNVNRHSFADPNRTLLI